MNKIVRKFSFAFKGLIYGLAHDGSIRLQFFCALGGIAAGITFHFTIEEMAIVLGFCAQVIALEYVNSAIEEIMNLEEPEINEKVGHIKDISAAAVLIASIFALITGLLFIARHVFGW